MILVSEVRSEAVHRRDQELRLLRGQRVLRGLGTWQSYRERPMPVGSHGDVVLVETTCQTNEMAACDAVLEHWQPREQPERVGHVGAGRISGPEGVRRQGDVPQQGHRLSQPRWGRRRRLSSLPVTKEILDKKHPQFHEFFSISGKMFMRNKFG